MFKEKPQIFDGTRDARKWLTQCERHFEADNVKEDWKVRRATSWFLNLATYGWWISIRDDYPNVTWEIFKMAFTNKFRYKNMLLDLKKKRNDDKKMRGVKTERCSPQIWSKENIEHAMKMKGVAIKKRSHRTLQEKHRTSEPKKVELHKSPRGVRRGHYHQCSIGGGIINRRTALNRRKQIDFHSYSASTVLVERCVDLISAKLPKHGIHVFDPGGSLVVEQLRRRVVCNPESHLFDKVEGERRTRRSEVNSVAFLLLVLVLLRVDMGREGWWNKSSEDPEPSCSNGGDFIVVDFCVYRSFVFQMVMLRFTSRCHFLLACVDRLFLELSQSAINVSKRTTVGYTRFGSILDVGLMGLIGARARIMELQTNTTSGTTNFSYTSLVLIDNLMTPILEESKGSAWNDTMGQTPACSFNFKQLTQGISYLAQIYGGCPKAHGLLGEAHFKDMITITTSRLEDKSSFQGVGIVRP